MVVEPSPYLTVGSTREILARYFAGRTTYARGELTQAIRDLGLSCSRERVRQLVVKLGMLPEEPKVPELVQCADCGTVIVPNKDGLCLPCRHEHTYITLQCVKCGRDFKRQRSQHKAFLKRSVSIRTGPACNRKCTNRQEVNCAYCGNLLGSRWASSLKDITLPMHTSCHDQAMHKISLRAWGCVTPDLLPMRDHADEIMAAWHRSLAKK